MSNQRPKAALMLMILGAEKTQLIDDRQTLT